MVRVLTAILSFYWAVAFTLAAAGCLDGYGGFAVPLAGSFVPLGTAAGHGLVAILFLWTAVTALADSRGGAGETVQIARLALSGAVFALTMGLSGEGASLSTASATPYAVQLGALLCTYLVVHLDGRGTDETVQKKGFQTVRAAARLTALGAAHHASLASISGRRVPADDEKDR